VGITELICSCCKKEGAQVYKHQIGEGMAIDLVMCLECFDKMNTAINKKPPERKQAQLEYWPTEHYREMSAYKKMIADGFEEIETKGKIR